MSKCIFKTTCSGPQSVPTSRQEIPVLMPLQQLEGCPEVLLKLAGFVATNKAGKGLMSC